MSLHWWSFGQLSFWLNAILATVTPLVVIWPIVVWLNVILPYVTPLVVVLPIVILAECHSAKCRSTDSRLAYCRSAECHSAICHSKIVVWPIVIWLNVILPIVLAFVGCVLLGEIHDHLIDEPSFKSALQPIMSAGLETSFSL